MDDFNKIKKVCSFYISRTHLVTMILPYINQEIENKSKIETFLEYDFNQTANEILNKIILKEETKNKIINIKWRSSKIFKINTLDKLIKKDLENNNINIVVSGSNKYIEEINNLFNKYFEKNRINTKITIINCYEVDFFNNNVREVLDNHEFILNTSGINKIDEVFTGYKKRKVND